MIVARLWHRHGVGVGVQGRHEVRGGSLNKDLLKHDLEKYPEKVVLLNEGLRDDEEGSPSFFWFLNSKFF